jgi:hypothetical protein
MNVSILKNFKSMVEEARKETLSYLVGGNANQMASFGRQLVKQTQLKMQKILLLSNYT